jgi:hypothetical protein
MSRRLAFLAVALGFLLPCAGVSAEDRPAIDAVRAAKIATDYLARLGPNPPYIVSLILEKSGILKGKTSWVALWSRSIEADGNRELGMRVNLDGTTAILVEDKTAARKRSMSIRR